MYKSHPFIQAFYLRLNDKIQPIILYGKAFYISNSYVTLWLISLTCGIFGCLILGLIPYTHRLAPALFAGDSSSIHQQRGHPSLSESVMENQKRRSKLAESERRFFLRHALDKQINVA